MDVLPLHFRTLWLCGVWRESTPPVIAYVWQALVTIALTVFTAQQFGALAFYRLGMLETTQCLFMSFTYLHMLLKLANLVYRRPCMDALLGLFRDKICRARTADEVALLAGYRKTIDAVLVYYLTFVQLTVTMFSVVPLLDLGKGTSEMFYPCIVYDFAGKENKAYFVANYAFQVVVQTAGTFVNIPLDTMLCGFALLTCAQIDLCCHRLLRDSSRGDDAMQCMKQCVMHHLLIRLVVARLREFFMMIVLPLLFFSLFNVCTRIYNLAQCKTINAVATQHFMSFGCMAGEVLIYCWYGNELKLKSKAMSETIYEIEWTTFKPSVRRHFFFIMLACERDLTISLDGFCAVTLEIFVWVLKTSYTAFNLLQSVSQQ